MKAFTLLATLRSLFFHAFQCCFFLIVIVVVVVVENSRIVKINIALQLDRALAFKIT